MHVFHFWTTQVHPVALPVNRGPRNFRPDKLRVVLRNRVVVRVVPAEPVDFAV